MLSTTPLIAILSLFAGAFALSAAIYLQFLGVEAPVSYAIGFYVLGSGILLILYEAVVMFDQNIIAVGVLLIAASEVITAMTIVRAYEIRTPGYYITKLLNGGNTQ